MAKAKVADLGTPHPLRSFNPRTGQLVAEVTMATADEVREAVARARAAQPAWAALGVNGRAEALLGVAHEMRDRMDDFVKIVSAETGKPEVESLTHDVVPTLLTIRYLSRIAPKTLRTRPLGRVIAPLLGFTSAIEWRPFGVVGCISPWNYPVFLSFISLVPALLAGNAVVLKPSEVTPATGELMREMLAVLPSDVAGVVQGAGEVGAALVDAPCDKICFVGSTATGRKIAAAAAEHLTPCVLELGGQDAAIVCGDAALDAATSGVLWGAFLNAGQTCAAIERAYVVESIADPFVDRLLAKLNEVIAQPEPQIGPLCINRQLETVDRHVKDAVQQGARVLAGGPEAARPNENGSLWYPPTVIQGRSNEMAIFSEETFGPVLPIIRVNDEEEAIRRANEEGYNLTASIWSTNRARARAIGSRIRAGTISINDQAASAGAPWGVWGGVGESGYGRLHGALGLQEFAVPVHVGTTIFPKMKKVWWYPYDRPTVDTFRAFADLMAARGLIQKVGAVRSLVTNGIRSARRKI